MCVCVLTHPNSKKKVQLKKKCNSKQKNAIQKQKHTHKQLQKKIKSNQIKHVKKRKETSLYLLKENEYVRYNMDYIKKGCAEYNGMFGKDPDNVHFNISFAQGSYMQWTDSLGKKIKDLAKNTSFRLGFLTKYSWYIDNQS